MHTNHQKNILVTWMDSFEEIQKILSGPLIEFNYKKKVRAYLNYTLIENFHSEDLKC